jgi:hypothetical protein
MERSEDMSSSKRVSMLRLTTSTIRRRNVAVYRLTFLRRSWMLSSSTFSGLARDIPGDTIVARLLFRHIALDSSCIAGETSLSGSLSLGLSVCVGHIKMRRACIIGDLEKSIEQARHGLRMTAISPLGELCQRQATDSRGWDV